MAFTINIKAMRMVPREKFVPPGSEEFAYEDAPLSIGEGQTISQPFIVALMLEKASLNAGHKVLEVGTGSGYESWDTATSTFASAMAARAGRKPLRSMPLSFLRAHPRCQPP